MIGAGGLAILGFVVVAAAVFFRPRFGIALGCLAPFLAFGATALAITLWPSGSSTDALETIFVPLWVGCGALAGALVGMGLRSLGNDSGP